MHSIALIELLSAVKISMFYAAQCTFMLFIERYRVWSM